jgi:hypothetical protein
MIEIGLYREENTIQVTTLHRSRGGMCINMLVISFTLVG